jgi:hypothetical protein
MNPGGGIGSASRVFLFDPPRGQFLRPEIVLPLSARATLETAHTGKAGDGFIAVPPVEKLFRIHSRAEAKVDEF